MQPGFASTGRSPGLQLYPARAVPASNPSK